MKTSVAIIWEKGPVSGRIAVDHGRLAGLRAAAGAGRAQGARLHVAAGSPGRVTASFQQAVCHPGPEATLVTVDVQPHPFTFLLRDVSAEYPIFIPEYGVAVTTTGDPRTYAEIAADVRRPGRQTALARVAQAPEADYAAAARQTRSLRCPTWLGLSRDQRFFQVNCFSGINAVEPYLLITPSLPAGVLIPETNYQPLSCTLALSRGESCAARITRRLEDGVLPILHVEWQDEDVVYHATCFCALETQALSERALRGTDYLVADGHCSGHMFTPDQAREFQARLAAETSRPADEILGYFKALRRPDGTGADGHVFDEAAARQFRERHRQTRQAAEETVLFVGITAVNTGVIPRYAWFKTVWPSGGKCRFNRQTGFSVFDSGRVLAVSRLNARPLNNAETAILLPPGATAVLEVLIPHRPISRERARRLAQQPFAARRQACRDFWRTKLQAAAQIELPEQRLTEMVKAGLLHLDLSSFGREPRQPLAAIVGRYPPIGTESAPIIQFFDSMGRHDLARRALNYFLEKQHADGFIQNYGGYLSETGPVLWCLGEHYRYTRDDRWAARVAPRVLQACDFLLRWRRRNQTPELRDLGYGLLEGKVADPEDPYHSFLLSGYSCMGIARAAELLARVAPADARRLRAAASRFRRDIRAALARALARGPVAPLGDGRWCPTCAPWVESRGLLALYTEPQSWNTHGGFVTRDALLGPLHLIFNEILDPHEPLAGQLIAYHTDLLLPHLVGVSQPYYSRHPEILLMRGEVSAFLQAYYFGFAGLADRETYTFWEHYHGGSTHKTHEEAWFLMQTRRMLWMEQADTLCLLPGIPRAWMQTGAGVRLERAASYFGPFTLAVEPRPDLGYIAAEAACATARHPAAVTIRLPHPGRQGARRVEGGKYDAQTETVRISPFRGRASIKLIF